MTNVKGHPGAERFVDADEMADILGIGQTTLYELRKTGLPSYTWGRRTRRFLPSEVIAWLKTRDREAA